jgi:hypothetical protein
MHRAHRIAAFVACVSLCATACTYESSLTQLQCNEEGEVDGDRVCRDGAWVERTATEDTGSDSRDVADDAVDVEPPEDITDTPPEDVRDSSDDDARDEDDVEDTSVEDAEDTATEDVTDTATEDATDTAPEDVADTIEDADDGASQDTDDGGGTCFTAENITGNKPLGYWPLDAPAPSGDYPHAGAAMFGPAQVASGGQADPTSVTGVTGNAVEMDGDTDYLKIDHHPDMLIPTGTIVFWAKVEAFGSTQGLFSKDASGNADGGHMTIDVRDDKKIHVRIQSDDKDDYTMKSQEIVPDQWVHVALTFGPSATGRPGSELFVDGVAVDQLQYEGGLKSNLSGEKADNDEPIGLGVTTILWSSGSTSTWPNSSDELDGSLDEVALFDVRLTPQQIGQLAYDPCP